MQPEVERIWDEFSAKLGQFIRARVRDRAMAEDILHDVFGKLQSRLDELQDPIKIQGWLFLVARNAIIDHYRTCKPTLELPEWLPAQPENITEVEEAKRVFWRVIDSLPGPYRDALVLVEFEGLTHNALAKRLGISLSAAKSRVRRGREQLKELLLTYCHREYVHAVGSQPCPHGLMPVVSAAKPATKRTSSGGLTKTKQPISRSAQ